MDMKTIAEQTKWDTKLDPRVKTSATLISKSLRPIRKSKISFDNALLVLGVN